LSRTAAVQAAASTAPQVVAGGKKIGGSEELEAWLSKAKR
jgi:glutaredoxin